MKESTWKFISTCFALSYLYLIAALIMLITAPEYGRISAINSALEMARMPQAIFIICIIGTAAIEERAPK